MTRMTRPGATSVLLNDGYVEQRPAGTWYRGDTSKMNMIL
jgi:hypothetical protein